MDALLEPGCATIDRWLTIDGKRFEVTVCAQPSRDTWHWMVVAPGELVVSGEATSEMQALDSACRAGRALARIMPNQ